MKNGKLNLITSNENIVLLDTETVNQQKIIVEFSGVVVNSNLIEKESFGFIIKDVWECEQLMNGIYASERKKEIWKQQLEQGTLKLITLKELKDFVDNLIKRYDLKIISAYNVSFDIEAYHNTLLYVGGYDDNDDTIRDLEPLDIWKVIETFVNKQKFVRYCVRNNFLTTNGNCKTNAETVFKYLSEELHFIETHIANEDIQIELDILRACAIRNHIFEIGKTQNGSAIVRLLDPLLKKEVARNLKKLNKQVA